MDNDAPQLFKEDKIQELIQLLKAVLQAKESGATFLVIKEHDFQVAKNSLKKYATKSNSDLDICSVPNFGPLGIFNHRVTGSELNNTISQVNDRFIYLNNLSQVFLDEFGQVYRAFEALDKDYISGIVGSIKAAEKVSIKEKKDRADIRKIVERLDRSVDVLKNFKEDIDKLKMNQKLKTAYIIAGSAVALTVIHFVLNVIGIL